MTLANYNSCACYAVQHLALDAGITFLNTNIVEKLLLTCRFKWLQLPADIERKLRISIYGTIFKEKIIISNEFILWQMYLNSIRSFDSINEESVK